jgi:hypothetical protein
MAHTQAQYDALKSAIAEGVKEVYYGDKRVVYRDLIEMQSILSAMENDLGLSNKKRRKYPSHNKGLQ